ncbi:MAG: hypothetical protein WCQ95_01490 [Bacteroidota bacterium]
MNRFQKMPMNRMQRPGINQSPGTPIGKGAGITERERGVFSAAESKFKEMGLMATPGYIRVERKLITGQSKYVFKVTRDSNADSFTEQKLERNDQFMASQICLFLMKRVDSTLGAEILCTYPDVTIFTTTGNPAGLESVYNGKLSVTIGQTKWIEALDTRRFRKVPTRQAQPAIASIQSVFIPETNDNDGFFKLTPQITIDGDQKNEIAVEIPANASIVTSGAGSGTENYLVLVIRGFLGTIK